MMKKVLGFLLAGTMVVSLAPTTLAASHFPDTKGNWCESYVTSLVEKKIVNGMEDGNFHPNEQVTRGAVAKLLLTAMQHSGSSITTGTKNNPLPDTAGKWSAQYIVPLCQAGIIVPAEYKNGFVENQAMSRLETIKTIVRTYLHAHPETSLPTGATLNFTDKAQITAADVPYVALGVELGIINGIPVDGGVAFQPNDGILRSEISAMISRFLDKCGKFSDQLGTSENRVDTKLPSGKDSANLPVIKTDDGKVVEWVIAPCIETDKAVCLRWFTDFSKDGLCSYTDNSDVQHFVDKQGRSYTFKNINYIGDFVNGLAPAADKSTGRFGFIDFSGKFVIPAQFKHSDSFSRYYFKDGTESYWATVCDDNLKHSKINLNGDIISEDEFYSKVDDNKTYDPYGYTGKRNDANGYHYYSSEHTKNGLFVITNDDGNWRAFSNRYGIASHDGTVLVTPQSKGTGAYCMQDVYDDYIELGRWIEFDASQQYIYDNQGKLVSTYYRCVANAKVREPNRSIQDYGEGYFVATDDPKNATRIPKEGFMKPTVDFYIPCVFDRAQPFHQGLAWVKYEGLWGLIKMPSK